MAAHPPPQHLQPPQRPGPTAQEHLNAAALCDAVYKTHSRSHLLWLYNRDFPLTIKAATATSTDVEDSFRYLVAHDQQETLYLAVRGTVDWKNWGTNLTAVAALEVEAHVGQVHAGFLSLAERLPLVELISEHSQGRRIVLCGHSLGGAVAALGTCLLLSRVCSDEGRVQCYTFGAPLFADHTFAEPYQDDELVNVFSHTLSRHDLVPLLLTLNDWLRENLENALPCVVDLVVGLMSRGWGLLALAARQLYHPLQEIVSQLVERASRQLVPHYRCFGSATFVEDGSEASAEDHFNCDRLAELQFPECLQAHAFAYYLRHLKDRLAPGLMEGARRPRELSPLHWAPRVQPSRGGRRSSERIMVQVTGSHLGALEPLRAQDVEPRPLADPLVVMHGASECLWELRYAPAKQLHDAVWLRLRSRFVDGATSLQCGPISVANDWHPSPAQRRKDGSLIELACMLAARLRFCHDRRDRAQVDALEALLAELDGVDGWVAQNLVQAESSAKWLTLFDRVYRMLRPPRLARLRLEPNELVVSFASQLFEQCANERASRHKVAQWVLQLEQQLGDQRWTSEELEACGAVPRLAEIVRAEGRGEALDFALDLHRFEVVYMFACISTLRRKIATIVRDAHGQARVQNSLMLLAVSSALVVVAAGPAMAALAAGEALAVAMAEGGAAAAVAGVGAGPAMAGAAVLVAHAGMLAVQARATGPLLAAIGRPSYAGAKLAEGFLLKVVCGEDQHQNSVGEREHFALDWLQRQDWEANWSQNAMSDYGVAAASTRGGPVRGIREHVLGLLPHLRALRQGLDREMPLTVAFVGEPGTGKSTLVSDLLAGEVEVVPRTTVVHFYACQDANLVDFPGIGGDDQFHHASMRTLEAYLPALDAVVLLFKAEFRSHSQVLKQILSQLCPRAPFQVCLSFFDTLVENKRKWLIRKAEREHGRDPIAPELMLELARRACAIADARVQTMRVQHCLHDSEVRILCERLTFAELKDQAHPAVDYMNDYTTIEQWLSTLRPNLNPDFLQPLHQPVIRAAPVPVPAPASAQVPAAAVAVAVAAPALIPSAHPVRCSDHPVQDTRAQPALPHATGHVALEIDEGRPGGVPAPRADDGRPNQGDRVTIQLANGANRFLCYRHYGYLKIGDIRQCFRVERHGDLFSFRETVSPRALEKDSGYLVCAGGWRRNMICDRKTAHVWERFKLEPCGQADEYLIHGCRGDEHSVVYQDGADGPLRYSIGRPETPTSWVIRVQVGHD
mmetsp:Transcript_2319/g.7397  ORF Transcript_2319/g.7397 Transcript_2319/m.7397 type:complete len:1251 (-) Transcript_2319:103-3855(-)